MNDDIFPEIIGQKNAKEKFKFFLEGFMRDGYVPPIIITGPKGQGKTSIARSFAERLVKSEIKKEWIPLNCAYIKNLAQFFTQIVIPKMANGQYVTVFLDETHELPSDLTTVFLSILKENEAVTKFYYDGAEITFDLQKITWIFATSEPQGVFHSLFDRLENVDLVDYDNYEMAKIIELSVKKLNPNFTFEMDALLKAADTCRGNGRSAARLATHIHRQLVSFSENHFTEEKWKKLVEVFQYKPKGLEERELILLKTLRSEGQCSLTRLSSIIGMTKDAVQKKTEIYLLKLGLIAIETPAGRKLTAKGNEYLANLDKV